MTIHASNHDHGKFRCYVVFVDGELVSIYVRKGDECHLLCWIFLTTKEMSFLLLLHRGVFEIQWFIWDRTRYLKMFVAVLRTRLQLHMQTFTYLLAT